MSHAPPIRALTSIRGFAAWWVVVYHFREALPPELPDFIHALSSLGYLAVDLFFILSGFVMALSYGHYFSDGISRRTILMFYGLRLARIYPLHLFVLVLYLANPLALAILSRAGVPDAGYDVGYYVMSLLLIQNWGFTNDLRWNVPAWSISTEWFAYIVFPALILGFRRRLRSAWAPLLMAVGLLLALALSTASAGGGLGDDIPRFGLLRCMIEFCIGLCLHQFWLAHPARDGAATLAALVALSCFAGLAFAPDYVVMPLGFFCLIYALTNNTVIFSRVLQNRVLEWIGLMSYSTYMVHYLVKTWVKFLLPSADLIAGGWVFLAYIVVTAIVSVILYLGVELTAQRWARTAIFKGFDTRRRPAAC